MLILRDYQKWEIKSLIREIYIWELLVIWHLETEILNQISLQSLQEHRLINQIFTLL
jgi:hypothetical protein